MTDAVWRVEARVESDASDALEHGRRGAALGETVARLTGGSWSVEAEPKRLVVRGAVAAASERQAVEAANELIGTAIAQAGLPIPPTLLIGVEPASALR